MTKTAFVGLAALAAGVFLGLVVWKERAAPPPPIAERQELPRAITAAQAPVVEKAPEPLRAQIESLCAVAPRAARGIITGTVVTDGGEPLANVRIHATPWRDKEARGELPAAREDFASQVFSLVEAARDAYAWRREARSDARGRFAIGGLDERPYELRAFAAGYECVCAFDEAPEPMAWVVPGGDVTFIALEMREVAVVLRLPDGAHPPQGTIRYRRENRSRSVNESDPSVSWVPPRVAMHLASGQWLLMATAERDGVTYEGEKKVLIAGRAQLAPVEIEVTPRFSIKGRAIVPDNEDGQVQVALEERDDSGEPDDWVSHPVTTLCDDDGSFEFSSLGPGTYRVSAGRFSYTGEAKAIVELKDRPAWVELTLPPLRRSDYVVLWVVDPRGTPLIGSDVAVDLTWGGVGMVERRVDGSWWIFYEPDDDAEHEDYRANVTVEGYGQKSVSWKRPGTRELVVQFEEPATVRVAFDVAPAKRGLASLRVDLTATDSPDNSQTASAEGDARELLLGPFAPGAYSLGVTADIGDADEGFFSRELSNSPVQLRSGMNAIPFAVPELQRLRVKVDPSLECDCLSIWSLDVDPRLQEYMDVGEDGIAEVRPLPPGNYRLAAMGLRIPGDMPIRVPGPAEVRFQPRTMNALRVCLLEDMPDGTPLRVGDTIVGIGGTRFTDMNALLSLLALLEDSVASVKVNVIRGNQEIEIDLSPELLSENYGGGLQPLSF